jgi:hypothetical protein
MMPAKSSADLILDRRVEYPQVPGLDQRVELASGLFFLRVCWSRRVEESPGGIDDRDPPGRSDQLDKINCTPDSRVASASVPPCWLARRTQCPTTSACFREMCVDFDRFQQRERYTLNPKARDPAQILPPSGCSCAGVPPNAKRCRQGTLPTQGARAAAP